MVKLNKIYTKVGDTGYTSLPGKNNIHKSHVLIRILGLLDELNSIIGIFKSLLKNHKKMKKEKALITQIENIQNKLFDIGGEISTIYYKQKVKNTISQENIKWLESLIDGYNKDLRDLESFIIPGSGLISSYVHFSRSICRRLERNLSLLLKEKKISNKILIFINRLSDFLFVISRVISSNLKEDEDLWVFLKKF